MRAKATIICAFLLLVSASAFSGEGSGSNECLKPPVVLTDCEKPVQVFYFSSKENCCLNYTTCPLPQNTSNAFDCLDDCISNCISPVFSCSMPAQPKNGYYVQGVSSNGLPILKYACNKGYTLIGPSEKSCSSDGTWTGEETKCVDPSTVTCPQPKGFIKAKIIGKTCIGNPKPGCFLMFSCEDNFSLMQGSLVRRCMENGRWQGEPPKCGRLVILYNGKEVKEEIKARSGDKNVLVECKMEPSFPSQANVDWSPKPQKDGNVSWILNKTSYALHFKVVHTDDAGDYTCTVKRTGVSLIGKVQIKVTGTQAPEAVVPPLALTTITYSKIDLTCFFKGVPKPKVTWKFNDKLVVSENDDRIEIVDQLPDNKGHTFSVLKIEPYFPTDFGTYECEAVNSAGAVAYQIPVSMPTMRRRRSLDNQPHTSSTGLSDRKKAALCTSNNTVVFIGTFRRQITKDTNHVKIEKILPSSLNYSYKSLPSVIDIHEPSDSIVTPLNINKNQQYIFIVRTDTRMGYTMSRLYPYSRQLGDILIELCS